MADFNPRTRNWTFLLYPESAPENWVDIIQDYHVEWVCSPLHNMDINPDDTPKKSHYHIMLMFGGVQTYQQVLDLIVDLNCTIPKIVKNVKSLVRYMCHLDNPDKYKYPMTDIKCYGGVDLADLLKVNASERYGYIKEMIEYIKLNHITESQDFIEYCAAEKFDTWFQLLCDNSLLIIDRYITSARHKEKDLKLSHLKNLKQI